MGLVKAGSKWSSSKTSASSLVPRDDDFYIYLTSTNDQAFKRNQEKLNRLPGKPFACQAVTRGDFDLSAFPTDKKLEVKLGAQLMLLNNDSLGRCLPLFVTPVFFRGRTA